MNLDSQVFIMIRPIMPLLIMLSVCSVGSSDDWTTWRGPSGKNVAASDQSIPTSWSSTRNVVWSVPVPGRGHCSPTVVGDLIVLTSADEATQRQAVFAFDRKTGQRLWGTVISQGGFPKLHPKNTHASSTACSDGERIYATFNHHGKIEAVALSFTGKTLWKKNLGEFNPRQYQYGYAASPTLHEKSLIVSADSDTVAWVAAFDTRTGNELWRNPRPKKLNWSSPIVARVAGREQLLISGSEMIASYDPSSGLVLWTQPCLTMATCGTVVWDEDTVYASGGYPKRETVAVKADGSGQIRWKNTVKCYEQSMLYHDGHVYAFDDNGIAYCWQASTGEERWKKRLGGPVSASPLLVGDLIYASNERGTTFVFRASPSGFEAVAENQLGTESFASPVVTDNRLYLRVGTGEGGSRQEMLYAIGSK